MAARTKSPEEWIAFLLTLIDHTKDFKPDWEGFAQNTGLYKRGKFVQQAYQGLRKKYAAGQFSSSVNAQGSRTSKVNKTGNSNVTIPKTPGVRVTKASKPATKRKQDQLYSDHEDDLDTPVKSVVGKKHKVGSGTIKKGYKRGVGSASDDVDNEEDSQDDTRMDIGDEKTKKLSDSGMVEEAIEVDNGVEAWRTGRINVN